MACYRQRPSPRNSRPRFVSPNGRDVATPRQPSLIEGDKALLLDLHQVMRGWSARHGMLRSAPGIEDGHLMHAGNRAMRSAGFLSNVLATDVLQGIFLQRNPRIAALLGAVVHQTILADVQVTRPSAAAPLVRASLGDIVLEAIDAGEAALLHRLHLVIHPLLFFHEWLQLSTAVVNNADGRTEAEFQRPLANGQGILRLAHASADDGVDVHVEIRVFREEFEFL